MSTNSTFFVILTLTLLSTELAVIAAQILTTVYLNVKLPYPNACPTPFYDGEDGIFLFGGCGNASSPDILKFSISSEMLQKIGSLPGETGGGTTQSDKFGNIFYLGGGALYKDVYKFNPLSNTTTTVATLPSNVRGSTSIKYNSTSNTIFILGGTGQSRTLLSFDMESFTISTLLTNIPFAIYGEKSIKVGNKAYIFDNASPGDNRLALELDLDTMDLQPVGPASLPPFSQFPSTIWDDKYGYVIGGYPPNTGAPTDGLIQFDPITYENNFIPVRNFPVSGISYFYYAPASVFVPNKNRIYFFGGQSYNYTDDSRVSYDDIFYIDLTPLEPTTTTMPPTLTSTTIHNPDFFTCRNLPNGLYPHPNDCSLFIGRQMKTVFSCSPPLLFDPVRKACNYPEEVECDISCVDKPDGPYPHPSDCSKYVMCQSWTPTVFTCPPPLLFNQERRICGFPDAVTCSTV